MITKYDVGDTVLLAATITGIEQYSNGRIVYHVREYGAPVEERTIVARIEESCRLAETQ